MAETTESPLTNPVLNGPYDPPQRHFEIGSKGPTGVIREGPRPRESFIPVAPNRHRRRRPQPRPATPAADPQQPTPPHPDHIQPAIETKNRSSPPAPTHNLLRNPDHDPRRPRTVDPAACSGFRSPPWEPR